MANKFKVFGENTSNIYTDDEFNVNQERLTGFQPNTPASSKLMNCILREATLACYSLVQICTNTSTFGLTMGPNTSINNSISFITTGLTYFINTNIKAKISTTTDTINGDTINFILGEGTSSQNLNFKIINSKHAESSSNADNVTKMINNHTLSSIFDTDGKTVLKAVHANNATNADSAKFATDSGTSTNANNAINAEFANNVNAPGKLNYILMSPATEDVATWKKIVTSSSKAVSYSNLVSTFKLEYKGIPQGNVDINIRISSGLNVGVYAVSQHSSPFAFHGIMFIYNSNDDYSQNVRIIGYSKSAIQTGNIINSVRLDNISSISCLTNLTYSS